MRNLPDRSRPMFLSGRWNRHDTPDEDLRPGGPPKDRRLLLQPGGDFCLQAGDAMLHRHGSAHQPLGVGAQHWPELVLPQVAVGDECRASMTSERGKLPAQPSSHGAGLRSAATKAA